MKAAVMHGAMDIRTETVPDPVLKDHGVIIKVKACGVCGSDLHEYKKDSIAGTIFGHEFSGDIVEVGSKVTGITPGMRVTGIGYMPCGKCYWCSQGKSYRCSHMAILGYQFPGAMAEYVHIPFAALGTNIFPLPDELTYEDGASIEPLSISYFSVKRGAPKETDSYAVLGLGVIGLYAIQALKAAGVSKIVASGRRPSRLDAAKLCGADIVIDAASEDATEAVMKATDMMGVNGVVECAGTQTTFDQSVKMARGGGKILLVGIYEEPLKWDPLAVISKNITLVGCLGQNFPASIDLMKSGKASSKPLITHRYPLDQAAEAFNTQLKDPNAIKVMIMP